MITEAGLTFPKLSSPVFSTSIMESTSETTPKVINDVVYFCNSAGCELALYDRREDYGHIIYHGTKEIIRNDTL